MIKRIFKDLLNNWTLFLQATILGTIVFFVVGNIFAYREVTDYGSWVILVIPIHIFISFLLSIPLIIILNIINNIILREEESKLEIKSITVKIVVMVVYIALVLYFVLFEDYSKTGDTFNFDRHLQYLIYYCISLALSFAFVMLGQNLKKKYTEINE